MESVVKTGKTVDAAIDSALQELGLSRDEVQVDILQLEASGFLGLIGKKEGKVRVTPLKSGSRAGSGGERKRKSKSRGKQPRAESSSSSRESKPRNEKKKNQPSRPARQEEPTPSQRPVAVATSAPAEEGPASKKAEEVIGKISECFGIEVEVQARQTDRAVNIRVVGNDVGQLIGRRGRTLGAVQYMVTRLINEDQTEGKRKVSIDVDGYNEDRESSLKDLAIRTAERVADTGKPVYLRPMSPPERRIIHLTLQEDSEVGTESVGEQEGRRVVVFPKNLSQEELREVLDSPPPQRTGRRPSRRRRRG